jgi:hypothetical protein
MMNCTLAVSFERGEEGDVDNVWNLGGAARCLAVTRLKLLCASTAPPFTLMPAVISSPVLWLDAGDRLAAPLEKILGAVGERMAPQVRTRAAFFAGEPPAGPGRADAALHRGRRA